MTGIACSLEKWFFFVCSQQVFPLQRKTDSTHWSLQSKQYLAGVDSTFPDISRACLSLWFVGWCRGSLRFLACFMQIVARPDYLHCFSSQMAFPVSTFSIEVSDAPQNLLTRGLVFACHAERCRKSVCLSANRWGGFQSEGWKGKWRDDNKAAVLPLCHGSVGRGMNTLTVSLLLCLFQSP